MSSQTANQVDPFAWTIQPDAAAFVHGLLDDLRQASPAIGQLAQKMYDQTGTRLIDWVDHIMLPRTDELERQLASLGFSMSPERGPVVWEHDEGLFPAIRLHERDSRGLAVKVESVADFLVAQGIDDRVPIVGAPLAPLRKVRVSAEGAAELWAIERHGCRALDPPEISAAQAAAALVHFEAFRHRRRGFSTAREGFNHAAELIRLASGDLGDNWACYLFFAAEREYWQRRNYAAQVQKARQDRLGLGWANHDHHTYRSSREYFTTLIAVLEQLGFVCRERFYGGRDAGWGAQVLEQRSCGIVIFADVDLTPEEVSVDFAHQGLTPQSRLGTVGLWCKLHGEAFLEAGMHHLECQFDFAAAREQLRGAGIETMTPFTDFSYLKQAFTAGEIWPVDPRRIEMALAEGVITAEQAEQFRRAGAIGSHLEILQRDDGYKGFNQTGISQIIRQTDPRSVAGA